MSFRLRSIFLASFFFGVGGVGCVSVSNVPGPDGETAHLIRCGSSEGCYEKADEICPEGYVLRSDGKNVHGYVSNGQGHVSTSSEMLVSCKADLPDEKPPVVVAQPGDVDRDDSRTCQAASAFIGEFGAYWSAHANGKLLDEKPSTRDFVAVCRAMPENVQRCMHDKYRHAHEKACDAVLLRLDPLARNRIDALYLEAPAAKPAGATQPGTTL